MVQKPVANVHLGHLESGPLWRHSRLFSTVQIFNSVIEYVQVEYVHIDVIFDSGLQVSEISFESLAHFRVFEVMPIQKYRLLQQMTEACKVQVSSCWFFSTTSCTNVDKIKLSAALPFRSQPETAGSCNVTCIEAGLRLLRRCVSDQSVSCALSYVAGCAAVH